MSIEIFEPVIQFLAAHPYVYTFVALLFVGESVLIPVIFLAVAGQLDIKFVFVAAVAATVISDSLWYWLGRAFPPEVYQRFTGAKTEQAMAKLEHLFTVKGAQTLFLSKFVYGTRIAAQVLSGVHRMPFAKYTIVNTLGVVALTTVLTAIGYSIEGTVENFGAIVYRLQAAFLGFVVAATAVHLIIGRILKKKWFQ
jgi:membrane protein DedA with SNARE-associated domain